jgi:hypothetical protein
MVNKDIYKCKNCKFEWFSSEKEYEECPDCKSKDIVKVTSEEYSQPVGQAGGRRGIGRGAMGAGPPRVCKCPKCGYESDKTPGVPCRNTKCPECGTPLCGAD